MSSRFDITTTPKSTPQACTPPDQPSNLAHLLTTHHRLERDAEVKAALSGQNALDLMLEGYAFRASIALPKEATLLEEAWAAATQGKRRWMSVRPFLPLCRPLPSTHTHAHTQIHTYIHNPTQSHTQFHTPRHDVIPPPPPFKLRRWSGRQGESRPPVPRGGGGAGPPCGAGGDAPPADSGRVTDMQRERGGDGEGWIGGWGSWHALCPFREGWVLACIMSKQT